MKKSIKNLQEAFAHVKKIAFLVSSGDCKEDGDFDDELLSSWNQALIILSERNSEDSENLKEIIRKIEKYKNSAMFVDVLQKLSKAFSDLGI